MRRGAREATFHDDDTVTFWSVYKQATVRLPVNRINGDDLATMTPDDQRQVLSLLKFSPPTTYRYTPC